jgi:hypothetical protein
MEFEILTPKDAQYPKKLLQRLGSEAPTLYFHGPLKLLDRFTLAVIAADHIPGQAMLATNDMLFTIREFALNYIGPWHSVMETEIFRLAIDTAGDPEHRRSLSICTARGLARETWDGFLGDRFGYKGPFTGFPQKTEFYRRARDEELLWLSITEPQQKRFERRNILLRNWISCALADLVFIPFSEKNTKSFITVKKILSAGIPAFTVDHEVCHDLYALNVPYYTRKSVGKYLESLGASKDADIPFPFPKSTASMDGIENNHQAIVRPRQLTFLNSKNLQVAEPNE